MTICLRALEVAIGLEMARLRFVGLLLSAIAILFAFIVAGCHTTNSELARSTHFRFEYTSDHRQGMALMIRKKRGIEDF